MKFEMDFSNIKDIFAKKLQRQMSVLHQGMWIFKDDFSSDGWVKLKEKVLDVSDSNQHAIPNSSLENLKIYSSKRCRKTSQK